MNRVYVCDFCRMAYEPEETTSGPRKLKEFRGYTVDLRIQQFRKVPLDDLPEFIDFDSEEGQKLLAQMHEEATR